MGPLKLKRLARWLRHSPLAAKAFDGQPQN